MKTSGVSCETKFGLLGFLGHPTVGDHKSDVKYVFEIDVDLDNLEIFTMGFMTRYITGFHTIADLANWSGSTVVDNGMLCKKSVRVSSRNPALVDEPSTNL